jgi:hypothetical protein
MTVSSILSNQHIQQCRIKTKGIVFNDGLVTQYNHFVCLPQGQNQGWKTDESIQPSDPSRASKSRKPATELMGENKEGKK